MLNEIMALAILAAKSNPQEVYRDLVQPGFQQVGLAIGHLIGLGTTALWEQNERAKINAEHNLQLLRAKLVEVPAEKVIPIPPEVGIPVLDRMGFVTNEKLAELYASLLAKAGIMETAGLAHPSFVHVINNLSPDEAQMVQILESGVRVPFVTVNEFVEKPKMFFPIEDLVTIISDVETLLFPQNLPMYISNFEGLGLVRIRRDMVITEKAAYENLEKKMNVKYADRISSLAKNKSIVFHRGFIEVTDYGSMFRSACVGTKNEQKITSIKLESGPMRGR